MFDTNVLSEHLKGNSRIANQCNKLNSEDDISISNVVWFEIVRGRAAALLTADDMHQLLTAQSRLDRDLDGLDRLVVYGVSERAAEQYTSLRANKKCKKMRRADLLIACIALAHGAVLLTRNVKDFAHVPGLIVQNWFD